MSKSKAELIKVWTFGKEIYRLVAVGNYSAGYRDVFYLEKQSKTSMDEINWDLVHKWDAKDSTLITILANGIGAPP